MRTPGLCLIACLSFTSHALAGDAADAHSAPPASARQLSGGEIQSTLVGHKLSSLTESGYPFSETLNADGTSTINISTESTQHGTWKVSGDVVCISYAKYGEECNYFRTDGVSYWSIDKAKNTTNNKFALH